MADKYRLFLSYREVAGTIYPVLTDVNAFERDINHMLGNRGMTWERQLDPNRPYGVSFGWLALCFAVFASGAQCTSQPEKERELTSQVFSTSTHPSIPRS